MPGDSVSWQVLLFLGFERLDPLFESWRWEHCLKPLVNTDRLRPLIERIGQKPSRFPTGLSSPKQVRFFTVPQELAEENVEVLVSRGGKQSRLFGIGLLFCDFFERYRQTDFSDAPGGSIGKRRIEHFLKFVCGVKLARELRPLEQAVRPLAEGQNRDWVGGTKQGDLVKGGQCILIVGNFVRRIATDKGVPEGEESLSAEFGGTVCINGEFTE